MKSKFNKYHSKKIIAEDGTSFDSKKEFKRFLELKELEKAGSIKHLNRQIKYLLIPSQYGFINGKKKCLERPCYYIADFVYLDANDQLVVEDTKGFHTKDYIIKRKLMLKEYGIKINEI